jgi:hypothetical protein
MPDFVSHPNIRHDGIGQLPMSIGNDGNAHDLSFTADRTGIHR